MKKSLILLTAVVLSGCAAATRPPVEFPVSPTMVTAYAQGQMTITWKSESNQTYTVYYTDAVHGARPDWNPLPQANGLRGTGKQITISDKIKSEDQRRYMLLSGNQKIPN